MTIFLTGTIAQTAKDLDPKRLNRQIQECGWLIGMIRNPKKWKNHPCNFMYKDYIDWIILYRAALKWYKIGDWGSCVHLSHVAEDIKPPFICKALYDNFKKRLYTKDPVYYKKWESYGKTEANYYFVDGHWWKYENGKKEIDDNFDK